jgi:alkylation response protein AidB-like acyl-CoA dehydrogenase
MEWNYVFNRTCLWNRFRTFKNKSGKQNDGTYKISGQKIFITSGDQDLTENIIHLVIARATDSPAGTKGISLFLVPKFIVMKMEVLVQEMGYQQDLLKVKWV